MVKPRKVKVVVDLDVANATATAEEIEGAIKGTLDSIGGVKAKVTVIELKCNCDTLAWPSYCGWHDRSYG